MMVTYRNAFTAWKDFGELVEQQILTLGAKKICEIGAGANPFLTAEFVKQHNIQYHLVDISREDLDKANGTFKVHIANFSRPCELDERDFDFVFSQMTLEHIENPRQFYRNIREMLSPAGRACLFYAAVTTLPMFVNYLLPDAMSDRILKFIQPFRKAENHGKFKAFYRWCYGPTKTNICRIEKAGFHIIAYRGFFGHSYYARIPILRSLEKIKTRIFMKHPNPVFCSYSHLVIEKR